MPFMAFFIVASLLLVQLQVPIRNARTVMCSQIRPNEDPITQVTLFRTKYNSIFFVEISLFV